jgi:hypothetical protein
MRGTMATPPPANLDLILTELGHAREDERSEREERRGLETRASALLAAGAALIGLVATAVHSFNLRRPDRVGLEIGLAIAGAAMLAALILILRVLNVPPVDPGSIVDRYRGPRTGGDIIDQAGIAERIRQTNLTRLKRLKWAARIFAFSVLVFVLALAFAALRELSAPRSTVTVVVHNIPGKQGPPGPRGLRGPRGRPDPSRG